MFWDFSDPAVDNTFQITFRDVEFIRRDLDFDEFAGLTYLHYPYALFSKSQAAAVSVPEPTSILGSLLALGAGGAIARCRRKNTTLAANKAS